MYTFKNLQRTKKYINIYLFHRSAVLSRHGEEIIKLDKKGKLRKKCINSLLVYINNYFQNYNFVNINSYLTPPYFNYKK